MIRPKSDRMADIRIIFAPDKVTHAVMKKKKRGIGVVYASMLLC
jgi:hypothetical protein